MDYNSSKKTGYGNMPNTAFTPQYVPELQPQQQQQHYQSQPPSMQSFGFYDSSNQAQQGSGASQNSFYNNQPPVYSNNGSGSNPPQSFAPSGGYYAQQQQQQQQQPQMFMPVMNDSDMNQDYGMNEDNTLPENEPPLLEELGINFSHIAAKTIAVLNPIREPSADILGDTDLAGPLIFCVAFGFCLLMAGKVHFGHIYLLAVIGCLSMYALLNLMSQQGVALILTISILGYCLLPMVPLSLLAAFFSLQSVLGHVLVAIVTLWCSMAASKLFSRSLSMLGQQALIAYPCFLVYGVFALLAVF